MKNDAAKNANRQNQNKIAGMLGIARRAGKLTTGFDAVVSLAKKDKTLVIFVTHDLSKNTLKKIQQNVQTNSNTVQIHLLPLDKQTLSNTLGIRKPVGVLALNDQGLATSVIGLIENGRKERHDA